MEIPGPWLEIPHTEYKALANSKTRRKNLIREKYSSWHKNENRFHWAKKAAASRLRHGALQQGPRSSRGPETRPSEKSARFEKQQARPCEEWRFGKGLYGMGKK